MSSGTNSSGGGGVTLPIEEVLRLTTLQDDEVETEPQQPSKSPRTKRRKSRTKATTPGAEFDRKPPGRTKSGGSTSSRGSRKLQKAVRNEKKSVDNLVAAAIRKYEDNEKVRTTQGRTKSGSSTGSRSKTKSVGSPKRKGRKKRSSSTSAASTPREQQQQQQQQQQPQPQPQQPPEETRGVAEETPVPTEIDDAGAIAVYPSDSDRTTNRRDRSAPHRISDISTNFATHSTAFFVEEGRRDSIVEEPEEVPEPPQSQVIHASVATVQQRSIVSDSETVTTAPTTVDDSGTVTARAVSSENYYQEVRRQLEQEAITAVAVIPLADDGKPMKKTRSLYSSPNDTSEELSKARSKKKKWATCAIILTVVLGVVLGVGLVLRAKRKVRNSNSSNSSSSAADCTADEDMDCFMDNMNTMMNSDAGQYWRERITRILPHSTLVTILQDGTFTTPQFRAFEYLVSNSETLLGLPMNEMMETDMVSDFTAVELGRIQSIYALVTLYYAMNGGDWFVQTNWLRPEIDICDWYGVECHGESKSATNRPILNNNNQLTDSLNNPPPGDLDDDSRQTIIEDEAFELDQSEGILENMLLFHSLSLFGNNLSGSIPEEISLLSNLVGQIHLSHNSIRGSVPSAIGELSRLQGLRLDYNDLSGTFPDFSGEGMVRLKVLDIRYNPRITGDVGSLPRNWFGVEVLSIENTGLTGTVPSELCDMLQLREPFEPKLVDEFVFSASCNKVECPCCTLCCDKNEEGITECLPRNP